MTGSNYVAAMDVLLNLPSIFPYITRDLQQNQWQIFSLSGAFAAVYIFKAAFAREKVRNLGWDFQEVRHQTLKEFQYDFSFF